MCTLMNIHMIKKQEKQTIALKNYMYERKHCMTQGSVYHESIHHNNTIIEICNVDFRVQTYKIIIWEVLAKAGM